MPSTESQAAKPPRRRELDYLRGVALIVMVMGHPLRPSMQTVSIDTVRAHGHIYGELFSAVFMFMSAVNVQNFVASAKRNPLLRAGSFYFLSSIALYLMGTTYNMIVGTLPVVDIIQIIAVGNLFTYLLLRCRTPAWGLILITAVILAAGLYIVGPAPLGPQTMMRVGRLKYLTALFGPIPWLAFFSYGILIDRIPRGRAELIAIAVSLAVFVGAHFLPPLTGEKPATWLFKANPQYMGLTLGLLPLLFLCSRRWYRGASRAGRVVEFWGVESLVFLVFHWSFIYILRPWQLFLTFRKHETFAVWSVSFLTLFLMAMTVGSIVEKRNQWSSRPGFNKKAWTVFCASLIGWGFMMAAGLFMRDRIGPAPLIAVRVLGLLFAFGSAYTFCFLYPSVRAGIRKACTRKETPA